MRILLVDNHDSFTWNLAHLVARVTGELPRVVKNDELPVEELLAWEPERVILSPGPGRPENPGDLGVCAALIARCEAPLLGVCLGHQAIAHHEGARILHAPEPFHGRLSTVEHDGRGLFAGAPPRFDAVRYHSLVVDRASLPPSLRVTAWTADGLIMAIEHATRPRFGVQFHPESILTAGGRDLLANFLRLGSAPPLAATRTSTRSRRPPADGASVREVEWVEPELVFARWIAEERFAFWLDSSAAGAEWSYLGAGSEAVRCAGGRTFLDGSEVEIEPFKAIGRAIERARSTPGPAPFSGGLVGYLGYELRRFAGAELPVPASELPDAWLLDAPRILAFDHRARRVLLCARGDGAQAWIDQGAARIATLRAESPPPAPAPTGPPGELRFHPARDGARYRADVERARALIRDGETYEACLTTQVRCAVALDPRALYRVLRRRNPAPFAAYLRFGDLALLSSSPERFVGVDENRAVESRPIKGTSRRGVDPVEDRALANALQDSAKDRAENLMIVDLVRNDLGRVCEPGSVHVPAIFAVEPHPTVWQLVSTVRGRLAAGVAPIECVRALFPGGSMTGAPKRRTMRFLDQLEGAPRGPYAGGLGFFDGGGALDLAMTIRTIVWRPDAVSFGVGGAIVAGSSPEAEWDEAVLKGRALMEAIAEAAGASGFSIE